MYPKLIKTKLNFIYNSPIIDSKEAFVIPIKPPSQFIQSINKITKYSLDLNSKHSPTITHFKGNISTHKDNCGLANFLVLAGNGIFKTSNSNGDINIKVKRNDLIIFDDTIEHSFICLTNSVQILVFNIH